ncbi:MAG: peptidase S8 and S53 subtilisin kexin sedolisin [Epulopiscium sp. Nele67-Bin004]|nr:MAG: peptidase S8 and S53 subtilisin kexin sedolisin [Epulopiscium sp. Nele67-Bin004]
MTSLSDNEKELAADYLEEYGFEAEGNIDIVIKYNGDIEQVARQVGGVVQIISEKFAVMSISQDRVSELEVFMEVEYMETAKLLTYNLIQSTTAACAKTVQNNRPYELKGNGVLLGIIDSGIQYAHQDFRNLDGTTRIASIWDQGISGRPPEGFKIGTEYTRDQINEALRQPSSAGRLSVVPSQDTVGHGTHVASIAGGNGNAGGYVGVAPEAEFIIVKLGRGSSTNQSFVRNVEIMLGIKYVIEQAKKLGKPIAINLSSGMNEGPHDGRSLIEQYIDEVSGFWKTNIVIASGNEGASQTHTRGIVPKSGTGNFTFQVGDNQRSYSLSVWKSFIDTFEFEIISPSGNRTGRILYSQASNGARVFVLERTKIYATFVGPSPLNGAEEFAVFLTGVSGANITSGIWTVNIYGIDVIDGQYSVWGPTAELAGDSTYMLQPTRYGTLTTPSTARNGITVGAYNSLTNQIAPFSGAGYPRSDAIIKPDLVAPGVDITAASTTGGYIKYSGTSMATPHVAGACALLMEWGIVKGNRPFLYGELLKTFLLRGTNKTGLDIPSREWGYGRLCVKNSLDLLLRS